MKFRTIELNPNITGVTIIRFKINLKLQRENNLIFIQKFTVFYATRYFIYILIFNLYRHFNLHNIVDLTGSLCR